MNFLLFDVSLVCPTRPEWTEAHKAARPEGAEALSPGQRPGFFVGRKPGAL